MRITALLAGLALAVSVAQAQAETVVKVGVTAAITGPAAALGIGAKNAFSLMPDHIGDIKVQIIVLDDATDTTKAVVNTNKLINEEQVDVMVGSSTSPQALAMINPIFEAKVPLISLAASASIVEPMDEKRHWVFKTAANDSVMADGIARHAALKGIKTMGFIGFDDSYGESWLQQFKRFAERDGIQLVAVERYSRQDTSVVGQVLKVMAAKPDAILIAGSSAPAAMPHVELKARGYKGVIYQTHGSASSDFLKVGGAALNGGYVSVGPNLVWSQLPDSNPTKAVSATLVPRYEEKFGKNSWSNFAGQAYDVWLILSAAIPVAIKQAQPGTPAFRAALRDAIEGIKDLPANAGVFSFSPTDHAGLDARARVIVQIVDGKWKYDAQ